MSIKISRYPWGLGFTLYFLSQMTALKYGHDYPGMVGPMDQETDVIGEAAASLIPGYRTCTV